MGRLEGLRKAELDLLSKFTPGNIMVKFNREQIADLEKQKAALEEKFPDLAASAAPGGSPPATLSSEKARLEEMEAMIESLKAHHANVQEGIKRLGGSGLSSRGFGTEQGVGDRELQVFQGHTREGTNR